MKSCKYIQNAIYLAPNEIRVCCQRFHVDGVLKGDVVLRNLKEGEQLTADKIIEWKKTLVSNINSGSDERCNGCSYLVEKEWLPIEAEKINLISIEDHSLCNMKCTYCSPTYYGGVPPQYKTDWQSLKTLVQEDCYFAWGGGEPTIRRDFEKLFTFISSEIAERSYHKIFTNGLTHSKALEELLATGRVQIITSIDAGNDHTFKNIRGVNGIGKVFRNLHRYYRANPNSITLKFILTNENATTADFKGFAELVNQYGLNRCPILISADFKTERINDELKSQAIELYQILVQEKIGKVIFDDHFVKRSRKENVIFPSEESTYTVDPCKGFAICGSGSHAELLSSKVFDRFPLAEIVFVEVDSYHPNQAFKKIISYNQLNSTYKEFHVIVGSTTFANEILTRLEAENISLDRVVPELCIL